MDWQYLTKEYRRRWIENGRWSDPDIHDCLAFLSTEACELGKAAGELLVRGQDYTRNNPSNNYDIGEIFDEIAGVVLMAAILADLTGENLDQRLAGYFQRMDDKRKKEDQ